MLNLNHILEKLNNKELIHKFKYTKVRANDLVKELKELVRISAEIKMELRIRLMNLELEAKIAEKDRLDSENAFINKLLDIH